MSFKSALQRDLDRFYRTISNDDFSIREVSKSALTQARAKLNPWAFQRLNQVAVDSFYSNTEVYTWHGMRTLAVDGTKLMLPRHETVIEEFGEHGFGSKADSKRSMATASLLYDVLNHITLDAQLDRYTTSERELMVRHLDKALPNDLLLFDRGYASFWLPFLLKAKGMEFCVRLQDDWWLDVRDFVESGQAERLIELKLPVQHYDKLGDYPEWQQQSLTCRLIRVVLDNGKHEILCTSLTDSQTYDYQEFAELYHLRWNEEEAYKLLKARMDLEAFSGKTAKAVRQDFFAKIFLMTMCAAYAHPIEEKVRKEFKADQKRKHAQQINRTNALACCIDLLIPCFIRKETRKALKLFDDTVYNTRELVRPNRSNPRPVRPAKKRHQNYKKL